MNFHGPNMPRFTELRPKNRAVSLQLDTDQGALSAISQNGPMSLSCPKLPLPGLVIAPLSEEHAPAAFALAQMWRPHLPPERWDNFLCDWKADPDGRGILAAHNQRGGLLGFVCWWRQPDLEHGQRLWAGPFITLERGVRPLVRQNLVQAANDLAASMKAVLQIHDEDVESSNLASDTSKYSTNVVEI